MTASNGLPCVRCGTSEWNEWKSCKECARRKTNQWRLDNPDRKKENDRRWQKEHPENCAKRNKKWKINNLERCLEITRISGRNWRKNNPEKQHLACNLWKKNNKTKSSIYENKRRAIKLKNGGSYTEKEWIELCHNFGNKCLACGKSNVKLTQDHVIPLVLGGSNSINNIQPLCKSCNCKKHKKIIDYRGETNE
jgi:hypothetical protein